MISERLQERESVKDPRSGKIQGRIAKLSSRRHLLKIGPLVIEWDKNTRFEKITKSEFQVGKVIKVKGSVGESGRFVASNVTKSSKPQNPRQIQLTGTVTQVARGQDGSLRAKILGVPVNIPGDVNVKVSTLVGRPDDRRPKDQFKTNIFGRPLTIGGEYEIVPRFRGDFALDDTKEDDEFNLKQNFELEMFYPATRHISFFVEGKLFWEQDLYTEDDDNTSEVGLSRGETWMFIDRLFGSRFGFQVGRQNIVESRKWWWNEDLDAIRLHYDDFNWHFEVAVAEEFLGGTSTNLGGTIDEDNGIDPEEEDVLRILTRGVWQYKRRHRIELFFFGQNDDSSTEQVGQKISDDEEDESDADLWWAGLRLTGKVKDSNAGRFEYWLDGAYVAGEESLLDFSSVGGGVSNVDSRLESDVRGWGVDAGISWTLPYSWNPTLTFGYAFGSGDSNAGDGTDENFRQTGLHSNKMHFNGVDSFLYYGELFRPELSNLHISTLALGIPFWKNSSIEFLYHDYWQVKAADSLRNTKIKASPNGIDKHIGQEWDVVIGLEEWKHVEVEMVGAVFRAGSAFGSLSGETAYTGIFKFNYNF